MDMSRIWSKLGQDIDGESPGDYSGCSVSLSADGSIVAIGANVNNSNFGNVRVYQWDNTTSYWSQLGQDIDGEADGDESGISVSLSADGSIVAIGAIFNDGINGSNSGHVRVYKCNNSTWSQLGEDIDGEAATDYSGQSVSLSNDGSIVAIGAIINDGINGSNSGHVRVYQYNGSTWTKLGQDIDGEAASDYFGTSVSLSADGSIVAIGANCNNSYSGSVRVYQWNNSSWSKLGQDIDGEAVSDESGWSVSLSSDGSIVAIGARRNDGINGSNSGHLRVYQYDSLTLAWLQLGQDIDGEAAGDESGWSVSLSNDGSIVAIGANGNSGITGAYSGHVRVYKWNNLRLNWIQLGQDIDGEASGDEFGYSVSLSGDGTIVAIGANRNDGNGANSGHVRVYKLSESESQVQSQSPSEPVISNVCFPKGTPINTDQGIISIEQINPDIHTIRNKKIVGVTQTVTPDKFVVCFEKGSIGENIPSQKTIISKNHKIFYKGKMIKADKFVSISKNVYKVKYTGEVLYNVLLEKYEKMIVNNLLCETLHPENIVAKMYMVLQNLNREDQEKLIKDYNKQAIKIFKKI